MLRGRGMRATKVLVCLFGATALAVCAWGMTTTDPGVVNGAFGVVTQVRVSSHVFSRFAVSLHGCCLGRQWLNGTQAHVPAVSVYMLLLLELTVRCLMAQNYVGSLLDVVDGGVKDADTIGVELDRVAAILAKDVNNTDIGAQMQVAAARALVVAPGVCTTVG